MAKSNKSNKSKLPKLTSPYVITLKSADGTATRYVTDSVEESLTSYKPELIKGKVIVDVEKGDKKISKVLFVYVARRLFFNNVALKIFARNVERALS